MTDPTAPYRLKLTPLIPTAEPSRLGRNTPPALRPCVRTCHGAKFGSSAAGHVPSEHAVASDGLQQAKRTHLPHPTKRASRTQQRRSSVQTQLRTHVVELFTLAAVHCSYC
eukprot:1020827-Prymnesium_polylepis.2